MPVTAQSHLVRSLLAALEGVDVVCDADVLQSFRTDQCDERFAGAGDPAVLVRPRSTAEVQRVVKEAATAGVPIVVRGAGSGLSGAANAVDGCVVLSTERMRSVSVDEAAMTATVGPGTITADLKSAAAAVELFYPPDPASYEFSTVGGNVATNAGGLCCVRHGVTRDFVLELEVVTADGQAIRVGRRTRKGVTGLDLVSLYCGSEGTLGVITEVTVRLTPPPPKAATMVACFEDLRAAGEAVIAIMRRFEPSMLELMDRQTIAAVEAYAPMDLATTDAAMLFGRIERQGTRAVEDVTAMATVCDQLGASLTVVSDEDAEGRMLMAARVLAYPALEHLGATLLDDVCVPLPRLPDLIAGVQAIAQGAGLAIATFGHAGDGNLHPTILYDHRDPASVMAARQAFTEIVELAIRLGGTATGEHGVGLLKVPLLEAEMGPARVLQARVKQALDPIGLFNPGKAL